MRFPANAHISLISLYSNSLAHLRERKAMISFRPLMNSDRFLQRESIAYARATFAGSRVFQASSARRTFWIALSRVNGGRGGRAAVVGVPMISSPGVDSFGISINSHTRAAISLAAVSREMA